VEEAEDKTKDPGHHNRYATDVPPAGAMSVSGNRDGPLIRRNLETRPKLRAVNTHRKCIRSHDLTLNELSNTIVAGGHDAIAILDIKGRSRSLVR
jgi:hypothetical protein